MIVEVKSEMTDAVQVIGKAILAVGFGAITAYLLTHGDPGGWSILFAIAAMLAAMLAWVRT